MIKHFAIPILVSMVLAFIRGIAPALVAMLAFLACIGLNRVANSKYLHERAIREIVEDKGSLSGGAQVLTYILSLGSVILMIASAALLFRTYDWVVGIGFIVAILGYSVSLGAYRSQPD